MLKQFYLYPRKNAKGKKIYYVKFRDQYGRILTGISSGQTSKTKAEAWAIERIKKRQYNNPHILFADIAKDFYNYDGVWVQGKISRGIRVSARHCISTQNLIDKLLVPRLGNIKVSLIDKPLIDETRLYYHKQGYASSTLNKMLSALKAILTYCEEKRLIPQVPTIERASTSSARARGILTPDEVAKVFKLDWEDSRYYTAHLMGVTTGMRMGEVLGLQIENATDGYIQVKDTWDNVTSSLKHSTKTGKSRIIPMPPILQEAVQKLAGDNPYNNHSGFLFFSLRKDTAPVSPAAVLKSLYEALECIGIHEEWRKRRNITFHSWRHFFNSFLINQKVPLQKVQQLTGHSTVEMSEHYYHVDDMEDVRKIQEQIICLDT